MSRKKKRYEFQEKKYPVSIFFGIDAERPVTILKPENNYYCKPITLTQDERQNIKNIKSFKDSMKRGVEWEKV